MSIRIYKSYTSKHEISIWEMTSKHFCKRDWSSTSKVNGLLSKNFVGSFIECIFDVCWKIGSIETISAINARKFKKSSESLRAWWLIFLLKFGQLINGQDELEFSWNIWISSLYIWHYLRLQYLLGDLRFQWQLVNFSSKN